MPLCPALDMGGPGRTARGDSGRAGTHGRPLRPAGCPQDTAEGLNLPCEIMPRRLGAG